MCIYLTNQLGTYETLAQIRQGNRHPLKIVFHIPDLEYQVRRKAEGRWWAMNEAE